jgi:hypothetical protein
MFTHSRHPLELAVQPRPHLLSPLSFTTTDAPFCLAPLLQRAKTIEYAKNVNRGYDDAAEINLGHPLLSSLHKMPQIWLHSTPLVVRTATPSGSWVHVGITTRIRPTAAQKVVLSPRFRTWYNTDSRLL